MAAAMQSKRPAEADAAAAPKRARAGDADGFDRRSLSKDGTEYKYSVWRPQGVPAPTRALVVLHGIGECGTDGEKQITVGFPTHLRDEAQRWPFVVLLPQKPTRESEWEEHSGAVMAMLDAVVAEYGLAPRRVAITGMSQGGHGALQLAAANPGTFSAVAPVASYVGPVYSGGQKLAAAGAHPEGSERTRFVDSFRETPVWLFHGKKDPIIPSAESQWVDDALRGAGHDSKLTIYPEGGHNVWGTAYTAKDEDLPAWLVEKTQ